MLRIARPTSLRTWFPQLSRSLILLALSCLVGTQPRDASARPKTLRDTTITDPRAGFAFELPRGYDARHVGGEGPSIAGWFDVRLDDVPIFDVEFERPYWFPDQPLAVPGDSLLSYVERTALEHCRADGPGGSDYPDSILSLRRYRTSRGYPAFEVVVRMVRESWPESSDEESSSLPDSSQVVEPDTTYAEFLTAGPLYAVDLSRTGARLVVWVRPMCGARPNADAPAARRIVQSLRRVR